MILEVADWVKYKNRIYQIYSIEDDLYYCYWYIKKNRAHRLTKCKVIDPNECIKVNLGGYSISDNK